MLVTVDKNACYTETVFNMNFFLDSVKFLILPKFNSNSIIELALLVFMYF